MPAAMHGFHEVLTRSLNELRAMLAAEHDREVSQLEQRVYFLECKVDQKEDEDVSASPRPSVGPSFVQRVHTDAGPTRQSGHSRGSQVPRRLSDHPLRPQSPHDAMRGFEPELSDSQMQQKDSEKMKDTQSLEPPKTNRSSVQSMKSEGSAMRRLVSDGGHDVNEKGVSGVRKFIRTAMRRRMNAQMKTRPSEGGDGIRSSTRSVGNADVQKQSRLSSAQRLSSRDAGPDIEELAKAGNSLNPGRQMVSPRSSARSDVSHDKSLQPVWPAEADARATGSYGSSESERRSSQASKSSQSNGRRHSVDRQYRPANFRKRSVKGEDEELLPDEADPGAPLVSRVSLPQVLPNEPLALPPQVTSGAGMGHRLSLAQQLTLMAFNPEMTLAGSPTARQALAGFGSLSQPGFGSLSQAQQPYSALLNQDHSGLSDLQHQALHQVLFSDGCMPGDDTCPVCDSCGNAFLLDAKFCRRCGKRRPGDQVCSCGNVYAPDALFCRNCGKARHSAPAKDEEEPEEMFEEDCPAKRYSVDTDNSTAVATICRTMSEPSSLGDGTHAASSSSTASPRLKENRRSRGRSINEGRSNTERKDGDRVEDSKDGSPEHLSSKLRQRREKMLRQQKTLTKEDLEEKQSTPANHQVQRQRSKSWKSSQANGGPMGTAVSEQSQDDKNKDRVQPWDAEKDESTAGDESEKKERPRRGKRGKAKDKAQRPRSRSPKEESMDGASSTPSRRGEPVDTSEGEPSDTDLEETENRGAVRGSVTSAVTSEGSAHSSSSEEGAAAVKPVSDEYQKRPSKKALRFSQKKRSITGQEECATPPSEPGSPQPPAEAAPQLPMLHIPAQDGLGMGPTGTGSMDIGERQSVPRGGHRLSINGVHQSYQNGPRGGRNSLLEASSSFRPGGGSILRGSLLGHIHSSGSYMNTNGFPNGMSSRRGSVMNDGGEWADDCSEYSDCDAFELLGVWSTQIWRKSMRVKRDQAGEADEEDLDYGNYVVVNEAVHQEVTWKTLALRLMIQPSSAIHLSWELMGLLLIMWDVVFIPLDVYEPKTTDVTYFMAWFLRVFWLLDILVSFMTGYLQDQGTLEMRPAKIAKRYVKTWLVPDFVCVGMDWATVVLQTLNNYRGLRIVRSVRLFRLLKAPEIDAFITEHIHSDNVMLTGNIIKSIILLMGVAHVIACIWYIVGKESASDPGAEGWVRVYDLLDSEVRDRYMWSLQWALGQFTGENVYEPRNMNMSERTYAVVVLLITFLLASMFVSRITTSVTSLQLTKSTTAAQMTTLRRYLVDADISTSLAVRVLRNAQHLVNEQKRNVPEQRIELLAAVSEPLRAELHFEVHGRVLREHSFFDLYTDINPQGIRKVCHMAIVSSHVSRGDIIFSDLETPAWPRMFFIVSGKLQYKQVEEKPLVLTKDQWAAEAVLWTLWMHVGTLRAMGESDLLAVEAEKLQHLISPHPTNHAYLYANTFVECLNQAEEDTLTDLDAKLVEPYLKQIFPERFHEGTAPQNDEHRVSGGVFAALPAAISPAASAATFSLKGRTNTLEETTGPSTDQ